MSFGNRVKEHFWPETLPPFHRRVHAVGRVCTWLAIAAGVTLGYEHFVGANERHQAEASNSVTARQRLETAADQAGEAAFDSAFIASSLGVIALGTITLNHDIVAKLKEVPGPTGSVDPPSTNPYE